YKTSDVKRRRTSDGLDESLFIITSLSYEEQIAEIQKRQETTAYKNAPFKCTVCYRGFQIKERYTTHVLRHNDLSGAYECFICKSRLKTGRALRKHLTAQHTEKFSCKGCPFVTRNRVDNGKPSFTPVAPPRKKSGSPPGSHNHKKEQSSDGSESDSSACQPNSALTRVREWDCEEIPPRPINSEEEYDTDSSYCGRSGKGERQSMLALPSKSGRGAGVMMDMATKLANEMWQKGKDAIEQAGNIKKEHRATAIECLQTLYETALALSDSRSRHKFNLERTSRRHAQEIIRSERAQKKKFKTSRLD
ncbi:hypothetical protein ACJJTC_011690, partial [Scirpophaga incertulas]